MKIDSEFGAGSVVVDRDTFANLPSTGLLGSRKRQRS